MATPRRRVGDDSRVTQHVAPHLDGGWKVRRGSSLRATKRFETREEAITYGRKVSRRQGADLYIHGRDGMVQEKETFIAGGSDGDSKHCLR